jgi:hypothetical protein
MSGICIGRGGGVSTECETQMPLQIKLSKFHWAKKRVLMDHISDNKDSHKTYAKMLVFVNI